ncbi:unnamed protein product [Diatraea saccharalis]|uniref:Uncharacterized protein n=1 Tax=Diatraea saccharalis TaxID=40085 RepID=A0A9N9R0N5_9NEOP|nr:unnamed protein product [Diatraea saccharalis]
MFVNGLEVISTRLEHIRLDIKDNMQPKSDRPPVCPNNRLPQLHITPSSNTQKKDNHTNHDTDSTSLLKPHHDIPATPPPQTKSQSFFPQRIG